MAPDAPVYFDLSWAILSTVGLANFLLGFMVLGITGASRSVAVPMIVSAAGALGNGLCVVAFYSQYPLPGRLVAIVLSDTSWLVEEAGLSCYGYIIVTGMLSHGHRVTFKAFFWASILVITAIRFVILAYHILSLLESPGGNLPYIVTHLHIGYFSGLVLVESVTSTLLLKRFNSARKMSEDAALPCSLFRYLMRSTEIRVAILTLISICRTITHVFLISAQSSASVASQIDRFAATLEILFPVAMYIDTLASRLALADDAKANALHHQNTRTSIQPRGPSRPHIVTGKGTIQSSKGESDDTLALSRVSISGHEPNCR